MPNGEGAMILVAALIFFFVMGVFLAIFFYFYWKARWDSRSTSMTFGSGAEDGHPDVVLRRLGGGLDPSILNKIPVTVHKTSGGEGCEEMECAVCLSEVADGENIRMLPGSKHGFHVECIKGWFHSHSTCPLCRQSLATPIGGISTEG